MKCPRGWILCQNDEGFTVPYFVKVRSTDVCVSSSISEKFGYAKVLPTDLNSETVKLLPPGQMYILGLQGWRIWLNNNETFKMTKSIEVTTTNADLFDNKRVRLHVSLPFKMMVNELVDIHIMKMCDDERLIRSFENISYGDISADKDIKEIYVDLYLSEVVADNYLDEVVVNSSKIVVVVEGAAQLGKYSHMDEEGQIGGSWDPSANGGSVNPNSVYTKDEVNAMIKQIRHDVENGTLIGPPSIVDVVDNVTDSVVLPKGIVFDVETPEEVAADEAQKKAQQQQEAELQKMIDDDSVIPIDINDLNL